MGGTVRIKADEYFQNSFIRINGKDKIIFGDGANSIVHLQKPYILGESETTIWNF